MKTRWPQRDKILALANLGMTVDDAETLVDNDPAGSARRAEIFSRLTERQMEAVTEIFTTPQPRSDAKVSSAAARPPNRRQKRKATSADALVGLTDVGNATRFVRSYGGDLRFCVAWNRWLYWNGKRWRRDDTGHVVELAKTISRLVDEEARAESNEERRQALRRHANRSEGAAAIRAAIQLSESAPTVAARPEDFDRDVDLLAVLNGTIDLRTGLAREHRRDDLITRLVEIEYHPDAPCSRWDSFLGEALPDPELRSYVQRIVGYSLTGHTREHKFFVHWGLGSNGKTTFLEIVRRLLGDLAAVAPTSLLLATRNESIPNDLARLTGVRVVSCSETGLGRKLDEEKIKALTGGDMVTARFLHAEFFEFKPRFKLFLATNHRPKVTGTDAGIWRRIALIPWTVTIPAARRDRELGEKLAAELPGILAWAVRGAVEWYSHGLGTCDAVERATDSYRVEEDQLGGFLADCVVMADDAWVPALQLRAAYEAWCARTGEEPLSAKAVGALLTARGCSAATGQHAGRKTRGWRGLRLSRDAWDGSGRENPVFSSDSSPIGTSPKQASRSVPSVPGNGGWAGESWEAEVE